MSRRFFERRFGEFPFDWETAKLKNICEVIADGTHFSPKSKEGPYKYVTSKNIRFGKIDFTDVAYISEEEHEGIYKGCPVQKGDLLITKDGANTGNAAINPVFEPFSLLSSVAMIRAKKKLSSNEYLLQFILSPLGQSLIQAEMAGQAITRITLTKIGNFELFFPPLPEQRKIAEILSTWDKAIATTEQLLANSQQQKKALMQQLLTGKKRFPGFEGEWKEVKIKEIFTLSNGDSKPHDTEKNLEPNKSIPVFGGNNIMGYSSKSNSNDTVILIGRVGEYCGVTRLVQHECWITDNALYTKSFDNNSDKQFITYLLQQYDLSKLRNKGGQPLISQKPIYNLKIMIPQKTEQKRIASSLTYTDKEIKLLEKQLANLKQEKKALMQQLLTGKRRVEI